MTTKNLVFLTTALVFSLSLTTIDAVAQSVFASGLIAPIKMIATPTGDLLVAESGAQPNAGRISIIDSSGNRRTLVSGLPAGRGQDLLGPTALALRDRTLYVLIGEGNAVMAGPSPGMTAPNPNPSSPILSSLLALHFSTDV